VGTVAYQVDGCLEVPFVLISFNGSHAFVILNKPEERNRGRVKWRLNVAVHRIEQADGRIARKNIGICIEN
jgi:hypothetical protein